MAGKMANWVAWQQRNLSEADFAAWVAGNTKVKSWIDRQSKITAVMRALDDLQRDIGTKVVLPAIQKASDFLAMVEKGAAPSESGTLKQSIGSTKAKYYPATFCGFVASGPRRGYARAILPVMTSKGVKLKRASKKFTTTQQAAGNFANIANPVFYASLLVRGRKAITAGQSGSGKKSLMSASGRFLGRSVKAAPAKNFMALAESASASAANTATSEIQLNLQKFFPE